MFTLTDILAMAVIIALGGAALAVADRAARPACLKIAVAIVVAGDCR